MTVHAGHLNLDGPEIDRWCEVYAAGRAVATGSNEDAVSLVTRLATVRPDEAYFAAWRDELLIGAASIRASSATDAYVQIYVDPSARRLGAGRALANQVLQWASKQGHRRITATVVAGSAGEEFARHLGATVVLRLVTVVRDLSRAVVAVPQPTGVRLLQWRNRTPDELLGAYAMLRQAIGDAPDAHLQLDAAVRTEAWVRAWEQDRTASGDELWVCAAVDERTGGLVGFTEVQVPHAGDAQQHDTAILSKWRGRGIATWLKADMLTWLQAQRPTVQTVNSTINRRNAAMLRVCATLGFQKTSCRHLVTLEL